MPEELTEVEVDSSAGTSCYYRFRESERYVVFAGKSTPKPETYYVGACSNTFRVRGNGHILDALRNKVEGGPPRLVGKVRRSTGHYSDEGGVPGATVVARSATASYEAVSDGFGAYEIRGIAPGLYKVDVSREGFVPNEEYNRRWSGRLVLDKASNTIVPDNHNPDSIVVDGGSCAVRDLAMWSHGRISGYITGSNGEGLSGVTVQAFAINRQGEGESCPLRTAVTGDDGAYIVEPFTRWQLYHRRQRG